jgi:HAD superfamily hydrolase (TIGR01549 family)
VTFDFWSTLVDGAPAPGRHEARMARLLESIGHAGHTCTAAELERAFRRAIERVSEEARESLIDVGPPGRWAAIARELGIPEGKIGHEVLERAYEDLPIQALPDAMPHVHEAVEAMKARGYRLAVICNTGMAGGRVLREVLRKHGLLEYFDVTVFSNEFGVSKPHPTIFEHTLRELGGVEAGEALHVGDLEELDIDGARGAGMWAALYAREEAPHTRAHVVVRDWRDFASQVAGLEQNRVPGRASQPTIAPQGD